MVIRPASDGISDALSNGLDGSSRGSKSMVGVIIIINVIARLKGARARGQIMVITPCQVGAVAFKAVRGRHGRRFEGRVTFVGRVGDGDAAIHHDGRVNLARGERGGWGRLPQAGGHSRDRGCSPVIGNGILIIIGTGVVFLTRSLHVTILLTIITNDRAPALVLSFSRVMAPTEGEVDDDVTGYKTTRQLVLSEGAPGRGPPPGARIMIRHELNEVADDDDEVALTTWTWALRRTKWMVPAGIHVVCSLLVEVRSGGSSK